MAQANQKVIALPRIPEGAKIMELWVDNDTDKRYGKAVLEWSVKHEGKVALEGKQAVDIPTWTPRKIARVDLSSLSKARAISVSLKLSDSHGNRLSTYEQEFLLEAYRPGFQPKGLQLRPKHRKKSQPEVENTQRTEYKQVTTSKS